MKKLLPSGEGRLSFLSSTSCSISFLRSSWSMAVESNASLTNSDTPGLVDISSSSSWGGWQPHRRHRKSWYYSSSLNVQRNSANILRYTSEQHSFIFLPSEYRWWKLEEFLVWLCLQKEKRKNSAVSFPCVHYGVAFAELNDPWISPEPVFSF